MVAGTIGLMVGLLGLFLLVPILRADFVVLDDPYYVTANPIVQQGLTDESIKWALTTTYHGNWFPLTWLSYMVDYQLYGLNPLGFHLSNLIYHLLTSLLFFRFLHRTTSTPFPSLLAALIFLLHPLHVESIAWVSSRKDLLSGLLWMSVLNIYPLHRDRSTLRTYLLLFASYLLALTSKPNLLMLPLVLLLLDRWPLNPLRDSPPISRLYRLALEKLPLLAAAVLLGLFTYHSVGSYGPDLESGRLSTATRVGNAFCYLLSYTWRTLYPLNLAIQYPHPLDTYTLGQTTAAALTIVLISGLALASFRTHPYYFVGWFWFVLSLAPNLQLIQIGNQATADRYMYVPLAGLAIALAWMFHEFHTSILARYTHLAAKTAAPISTAVLIALLGLLSYRQAATWQSSISVFQHAVRNSADNPAAHAYLAQSYTSEGSTANALHHYHLALELNPEYYFAFQQLAALLARLGRSAELVSYANQPAKPAANPFVHHIARGSMLYQIQKLPDARSAYLQQTGTPAAEDALQHFRQALNLNPDDPQTLEALHTMGVIELKRNRFGQAAKHFEALLQSDPNRVSAHALLAFCQFKMGDTDQAKKHVTRALELDPHNKNARALLAQLTKGL